MGNLIASIFGGGVDPLMHLDLDFTPGAELQKADGDDELIAKVHALLERGKVALSKLRNYNGCASIVRKALSDSRNFDLQKTSFEGVSPNIIDISTFYYLSVDIAKVVAELTSRLVHGRVDVFEQHAAIAKCLGDVLLFSFEFDQQKMLKPEIQNDFSFYRRALGTKALDNVLKPVSADVAHVISMWIAQNLPMTNAIINIDSVPLAALSNLCCGMVQRQTAGPNLSHILRVMVASIIVFDRVNDIGAFHPASLIKMRKVVSAIAKFGGEDRVLLSDSLKFSTIHYKDDTTPEAICIALGDV